jgi:hypothetical protein
MLGLSGAVADVLHHRNGDLTLTWSERLGCSTLSGPEVFRRYKRSMLVAMLVRIGENTSFYILTTFLVFYGTQILRLKEHWC